MVILLHEHAVPLSRLLKTMANESRLIILSQLMDRERNVGELSHSLGMRQPALSQHLAKFRRAGLVGARRKARTIFYSVSGPLARRVIEALIDIAAVDAMSPLHKPDPRNPSQGPNATIASRKIAHVH